VIAVSVGDDRALDGLPRIDVEVAAFAVEAGFGWFDQLQELTTESTENTENGERGNECATSESYSSCPDARSAKW
jgi:hypothetical protein